MTTGLRRYPGTREDERTAFVPYSAFEIPQDLRALHGRFDVDATARRVRNFRYAEGWLMMMLAGWIATIPELPVKTGLGKIVWETAQDADALGKRLPELRAGRNERTASEVANEGFAAFVRSVAAPEDPEHTIEKLTGTYDVFVPHLIEVYEATARRTDQIADAPTVALLEGIVGHKRKHVVWGREVLARLCDTDGTRERRRARAAALAAELAACGGVTGDARRS